MISHEIELILGLLVAVAALAWLAARLKVPYPILMVIGGLFVWLLPGLPVVKLKPEIVFLVFLPPLLYYQGTQTSWRDFRVNLRPIAWMAIGLVLFTTCAIAIIAHAMIPEMTWAAAFVLGAIISPPDAVAATAITERLRIPTRLTQILEGESLVNDASALVAYRFGVLAVIEGAFSLPHASLQFVLAAAGGIVIGWVAGMAVMWARPRLRDPAVESTVSLLTPFIAYLPAEWLGVSGVLAAVTCGLYVGRRIPRVVSSRMRIRLNASWEMLVFLLNGLIFILIGLQLPVTMQGLASHHTFPQLIGYVVLICAAAVVIRLAWVFTSVVLRRFIRGDRFPVPPWQHLFLVGWTGMRGIVSLAAALALPEKTLTGQPFPGRDLILFITFGVILFTLVGQGLTLPMVIRWLGLKGDDIENQEERQARLEGAHAALARLEALAYTTPEAIQLIDRVRVPYRERVEYFGGQVREGAALSDAALALTCSTIEEIQREAIRAERLWLIRLRDDDVIGDDVLRTIMRELDLEETALLEEGDGEHGHG